MYNGAINHPIYHHHLPSCTNRLTSPRITSRISQRPLAPSKPWVPCPLWPICSSATWHPPPSLPASSVELQRWEWEAEKTLQKIWDYHGLSWIIQLWLWKKWGFTPHKRYDYIYIYIDTVYLGEPAGRYRQSKWLSTLVNHQLFLEVFGQWLSWFGLPQLLVDAFITVIHTQNCT